jgi:hypothetical protein
MGRSLPNQANVGWPNCWSGSLTLAWEVSVARPQTVSAVKRAASSALCSVFQFCVAEDREKQLELIAYRHTSTNL